MWAAARFTTRWESLVRVERPLSRGIERFTGITQGMVDGAPPPAEVLPELQRLMRGRVLVAHNASFDRRVLKQAFDRCDLEWPDPPVICTVALARRCAPLVRRRGLSSLADALGIEVEVAHRALPDALTCARVLCALFPKLCVLAATVGDAVQALGSTRSRRQGSRRAVRRRPPADRPDLSHLPEDPGVYVFRDVRGRPLYVGKSVSLRTRARSHFCAPAGWTERAEIVDYRATRSELGALVLENRLIKQWRPPGNKALKRTDRWAYVRCRLDVEYPVLEASSQPAAGRAINVGPVRGRKLAAELADHLTSLFKLRHCGRALRRRDSPSIYGQMGRCCSPCLGDLDPNAYRRQVDAALALFEAPEGAAAALLEEIDDRMATASREQRYEAAAALARRRERLAALLDRLDGVLRAVHADPRLVLARHPTKAAFDAFWLVAGRVVDWGPLEGGPDELARRTEAVLAAAPKGPGRATAVPAEEVDEVRIASAWIAEHAPPELAVADAPSAGRLTSFLAAAAA